MDDKKAVTCRRESAPHSLTEKDAAAKLQEAERGVSPRMLRLPRVEEQTGFARSSIYRAMRDDGFPQPVRIGRRAVAWVQSEVEDWLRRKLAARSAT